MEGEPPDKELINKIGNDGVIKTPVILDTDLDVTVSGRHRLAAGYDYNLPVPVIMLFR